MNGPKLLLTLDESTPIRELLLTHPKALRVLLSRGIPATCSTGTIRDAARAGGTTAAILLAELRSSMEQIQTSSDSHSDSHSLGGGGCVEGRG